MTTVRWEQDLGPLQDLLREFEPRLVGQFKEELGEIAFAAGGGSPVDTGALSESYYTATSDGASNYSEHAAAVEAKRGAQAVVGPEPPPEVANGIGGVVASAANYAAAQEDGAVTRNGGFVAPRPHLAPAVDERWDGMADRLGRAAWGD